MLQEIKDRIPYEDGWFTTKDGVRLHYVKYGTGAPMIVIPGWSSVWESFILTLEEIGKNSTMYILENRGHGLSEDPGRGFRLARIAKDNLEFMESLGLEKADWMCHSMGCCVIWQMIELFGQDFIDRLVLIDEPASLLTNPDETQAEGKAHGGNRIDPWQCYNGFQRSWDEGCSINDTFINRYWFKQFENPDNKEIIDEVGAIPRNASFLGKVLFDHQTRDWRDIIPLIHVPTLLLTGDVSHVTTYESSKWIHDAIPGCKWVRFSEEEHGTHNLMLNSPEKFCTEVRSFLDV